MNWPIFWITLTGISVGVAICLGYVFAGMAIERALVRRFGDIGYFFPFAWVLGGGTLIIAIVAGLAA